MNNRYGLPVEAADKPVKSRTTRVLPPVESAIAEMRAYERGRLDRRLAIIHHLRKRTEREPKTFDAAERRKIFNYPTDFTDKALLELYDREAKQ